MAAGPPEGGQPGHGYNEDTGADANTTSGNDFLKQAVFRDHTWTGSAFITAGLSMCITVDILQYSMPLAFLPSVLEDRGHRPMVIATAIGVYYWTGFAGGAMITSYQIYKLVKPTPADLEDEDDADEVVSVGMVRRQLQYLIIALGIGTATLLGQALHPHCWMHTACRFVQGFIGAFIFFYAFLLSVGMFKGQQQVFAMTMASTALNIAEVLGSSLGAWIFDNWGQRTVFWSLMIVSITNQVLLCVILARVQGDGIHRLSPRIPCMSPTPGADVAVSASAWRLPTWIMEVRPSRRGVRRLKEAMSSSRLRCAVVLIATAAMVKSSMEEVLPFHADHRWGQEPLEIGRLFSIIAVAYISAAILSGRFWEYLNQFRVLFSSFWLMLLGFSAWSVYLTAYLYKHESALWFNLVTYGICLGLTHTPAALLLAEAIDHETGRAKDAVNGVWNTMWEAGGSLGFLLGGLIAENYERQLNLFAGYAACCTVCAVCMLMFDGFPSALMTGSCGDEKLQATLKCDAGYGTSA